MSARKPPASLRDVCRAIDADAQAQEGARCGPSIGVAARQVVVDGHDVTPLPVSAFRYTGSVAISVLPSPGAHLGDLAGIAPCRRSAARRSAASSAHASALAADGKGLWQGCRRPSLLRPGAACGNSIVLARSSSSLSAQFRFQRIDLLATCGGSPRAGVRCGPPKIEVRAWATCGIIESVIGRPHTAT